MTAITPPETETGADKIVPLAKATDNKIDKTTKTLPADAKSPPKEPPAKTNEPKIDESGAKTDAKSPTKEPPAKTNGQEPKIDEMTESDAKTDAESPTEEPPAKPPAKTNGQETKSPPTKETVETQGSKPTPETKSKDQSGATSPTKEPPTESKDQSGAKSPAKDIEPPKRVEVGKARGIFHEWSDEDKPFKTDEYGDFLSADPDLSQPFQSPQELEAWGDERYEEYSQLFRQGVEDAPDDWYSLFHEIMHEARTKTSEYDADERDGLFTEQFQRLMVVYAFRLAATPVHVFGDKYNAEANTIRESPTVNPWLAAKRLFGNVPPSVNTNDQEPSPTNEEESDSDDDVISGKPWQNKADGVANEPLSDSDGEPQTSSKKAKKTKKKSQNDKKKMKKKKKKKKKKTTTKEASKGISLKGLERLRELNAAFEKAKQEAKKDTSVRPARAAKEEAINKMAAMKPTARNPYVLYEETLQKMKRDVPLAYKAFIEKHPSAMENATSKSDEEAVEEDAVEEDAVDKEEEEEEEEENLWAGDEEEEEEEVFVEPKKKQKKKRKALGHDEDKSEKKRKAGRKVEKKSKKNSGPEKEPRECWPERKAWVRPETLKQMMDITTRGKVKALKKPVEILQYATLPYARSPEYEQTTNKPKTGAIREQLGWPWNIHGVFHYCEQKANASGNTTKTPFMDTPELHFWVGSESAGEKIAEIMNGEQPAKVVMHTEYGSFVAHFRLPENRKDVEGK